MCPTMKPGTVERLGRKVLWPEYLGPYVTRPSVGLEPERTHWLTLYGDPCSVLRRVVNPPVSANLLVVGSRGADKHSGTILGSTSIELAEVAAAPPLVIVPCEPGSEDPS